MCAIQHDKTGSKLVVCGLRQGLPRCFPPQDGIERLKNRIALRACFHDGEIDSIGKRKGCAKDFSAADHGNFIHLTRSRELARQRQCLLDTGGHKETGGGKGFLPGGDDIFAPLQRLI